MGIWYIVSLIIIFLIFKVKTKSKKIFLIIGLIIYLTVSLGLNTEVRLSSTHGNTKHGWYSKYNSEEKFVAVSWFVAFPIGLFFLYNKVYIISSRREDDLEDNSITQPVDDTNINNDTYIKEYVNEYQIKEIVIDMSIEKAVRIYYDSFLQIPPWANEPINSKEEIDFSSGMLDEDIKKDIMKTSLEEKIMWDNYELKFGHRGAASSKEESNFRDPVIKVTTIKKYNALDEQLRRENLSKSIKPSSWDTYYDSGKIDEIPIWKI